MPLSLERIVTPSDDLEPLTVTELKAHLRVDGTDEDTYITSLGRVAREVVEDKLTGGRALKSQAWRFHLDRFPEYNCAIRIPRPPLLEVTAFTYIDINGDEQELVEDTDFIVDLSSEPGRVKPAYSKVWPAARWQQNAITIEFTAGYETVPDKYKQAIMLMVGHWYENREEVTDANLSEIPMAAQWLCSGEPIY